MSKFNKITCIICKKTPGEQGKNRRDGWTGEHCTPGRCIVIGSVYRTFPDGVPVDWKMNTVDAKILEYYKAFKTSNG